MNCLRSAKEAAERTRFKLDASTRQLGDTIHSPTAIQDKPVEETDPDIERAMAFLHLTANELHPTATEDGLPSLPFDPARKKEVSSRFKEETEARTARSRAVKQPGSAVAMNLALLGLRGGSGFSGFGKDSSSAPADSSTVAIAPPPGEVGAGKGRDSDDGLFFAQFAKSAKDERRQGMIG
jgi:hypothetical protein